jgi:hypothetical protein
MNSAPGLDDGINHISGDVLRGTLSGHELDWSSHINPSQTGVLPLRVT